MRRSVTKALVGHGQARYTVRIESEPCEPGTMEARREQVGLLRSLTDNIELLNCGYSPFQKFSMRHTGEYWLVEMEAVGPE